LLAREPLEFDKVSSDATIKRRARESEQVAVAVVRSAPSP
jgi:hypothetical protein